MWVDGSVCVVLGIFLEVCFWSCGRLLILVLFFPILEDLLFCEGDVWGFFFADFCDVIWGIWVDEVGESRASERALRERRSERARRLLILAIGIVGLFCCNSLSKFFFYVFRFRITALLLMIGCR